MLSGVLNSWESGSFKPYYKWIIFNIDKESSYYSRIYSFKPYYKWIIFNIESKDKEE